MGEEVVVRLHGWIREVVRLHGWIREVLGFHFFLVFLGKYNLKGVVGNDVLGLLMCFRGELLGLQFFLE